MKIMPVSKKPRGSNNKIIDKQQRLDGIRERIRRYMQRMTEEHKCENRFLVANRCS